MPKKNGVRWDALLLAFFLFIWSISLATDLGDSTNQLEVSDTGNIENGNRIAGTPHAPIVIDGDTNFSVTASNEGWLGDGSSGDPFIIDGLDIDLGGALGHCIDISNTQVNFTISNCNLMRANVSPNSGIYLNNVTNGKITDNIFLSNYFGVYIIESDGNTIEDNEQDSNTWGIFLQSSDGNIVANNNCTNHWRGIHIQDSNLNILTNNSCNYSTMSSVTLTNSDSNIVIDNICNNQVRYGIQVQSGFSNKIINNTCISYGDYGIYKEGMDSILLANNTCIGGLRGIFGVGEFVVAANNTCINSSIGIIIEALSSIVTNNTCIGCSTGIFVDYGDSIITSNTCNNNVEGIRISGIDNFLVANNTCCGNSGYGIFIDGSSPGTITWNVAMNNTMANGFSNFVGNTYSHNYWSDYVGPDADGDGIGDTPFPISGIAGNWDWNPLMLPPGSLPIWLDPLGDHLLECGMSFHHDLNATAFYPGVVAWWLNDTDHFSIDHYGVVTNTTALPPGTYGVQIFLNDLQGNILNGVFSLTMVDTTFPEWLEQPEDQILECGVSLHYELSATDMFLDKWWLNDTMHFAIDQNGLVTTTGIVPTGIYGVHVWVNDTSGLILTGNFTVTVVDTLAPTWIENPQDQLIEFGTTFICDLNATDPSGIGNWWVDDTAHFSIDWLGQIRSIGTLEPGIYGLRVYVDDIYGHLQWVPLIIEVVDTTPPEWLVSVTDQYLEYGESLEYQLSAYDLSGIVQWSLDDTTNFEIDPLGLITSIGPLDPGSYDLRVTVTDPYGNELSVAFTIIVSSETTTSTTTTTTTVTATTTTDSTTTGTTPEGINPVMTLVLGTGIGGAAVVVIVIVFLKKKS